jgi:hypothetical protein
VLKVDRVDVVEHDLGVEALGVLQEALHQFGALHAVTSAGQLSTSVVVISWPPWAMPVISMGCQVGACGVDGGGVAGGAGTQDQDAGVWWLAQAWSGMWWRRLTIPFKGIRGAPGAGTRCNGHNAWILAEAAIALPWHRDHPNRSKPMSMLSNLDLIRRVPLFSMLTSSRRRRSPTAWSSGASNAANWWWSRAARATRCSSCSTAGRAC